MPIGRLSSLCINCSVDMIVNLQLATALFGKSKLVKLASLISYTPVDLLQFNKDKGSITNISCLRIQSDFIFSFFYHKI